MFQIPESFMYTTARFRSVSLIMPLAPKQKDRLNKENCKSRNEPENKLCKHCLEPPIYCTCIEEIIKESDSRN